MKSILPLLLLAALCASPSLAPAQAGDPTPSAPKPVAVADPWAPTHGVKSAEQIDKEWQDSVTKFDARRNALLKEADRQGYGGPYRPDWETLRNHEIPQWFKDAKLGIFIGWGIYAVPGAVNEWYPHNMYKPVDPAHDDFVKRMGSFDKFGYKDFIPSFRAEKFDPNDWAALFKKSGAKYVIPIAEHHDGFAMYDSDLSDWTAAKMGPHRDVLAELSKATREAGLHFGFSYHRAEHNYYYGEGRHIRSDVNDPKYASFYGPAHEWLVDPNYLPTDEWTYVSDAWLRDWLARSVELVEKYKPELIYFDGGNGQPAYRSSMTEFTAFYDNYIFRNHIDGVITLKGYAMEPTAGARDFERSMRTDIDPRHWQTDTAISNLSWGYMEHDDFKTPDLLIHQLVDTVSKNGNLLLSIGPRADGTIPDEVRSILLEIGAWLDRNGEAIYATEPWTISGEGPTEIKTGFGADQEMKPYSASDFRFTQKDGNLYVISLACPQDGTASVRALGLAGEAKGTTIEEVSLLGSSQRVEWLRTTGALNLKLPQDAACKYGFALRVKLTPLHQ
ncbi:MAG: alpha-L-fucosidase [Terracidiphilus sp.]|jgi:alpha-L-fucosidase